jgi:hypothetical protein
LIAFLIATLSGIYRLLQEIYHRYSSRHKVAYLRALRSSLLRQQEIIVRQLAGIDTILTEQTQLTSSARTVLNCDERTPSTSLSEDQQQSQLVTPTRIRQRTGNRQSSIFIPYPLPYTPPRTPEEERRNNITIWINELRAQNYKQDGTSK